MKKVLKILAVTSIFVGVFVLSALGAYLMLHEQDISDKGYKETLMTLKESLPRAYVVQSGSMEPAIMTGSLILSIPQNNYRSGEVITFERGSKLITHRAMYQEFTLDESYFITKGDANEETDVSKVAQSDIVGKVMLTVPYVGYVADFAKQPAGFILLVIVPATIVIYEELKTLFKELLKQIKRMKASVFLSSRAKSKDLNKNGLETTKDPDVTSNDMGKLIKGFAVIPIIGAVLTVSAFSVSYFFDSEKTVDNVFSAAANFGLDEPIETPTPSPTPVEEESPQVSINEVYTPTGNDWIEIYNYGSTDVSIEGWTIEDTASSSVATLTGSLLVGEYIVINAGNRLNNGGDDITLENSDGVVDSFSYSTTPEDTESFGRNPDGTGVFGVCATITQGTSNLSYCN